MRAKFLFVLMLFPAVLSAQTGITFKVEELTKPKSRIEEQVYDGILNSKGTNTELIAKSPFAGKLVNLGSNPFFSGLYRAYADHRPFVLSPDMIWLLITQGFARHVNQNAEELRKDFVDFDGKLDLVVEGNIRLSDPNANWQQVFSGWNAEIAGNTKNNVVKTLTADFSTTTPVSKAVSQVTIMETVKSYFEFAVIRVVCGIPEITLEGTPEDWEKILAKAQKLKKYKLEWWINELEPVLQEFVKTSKGKPNTAFWKDIFKERGKGGCGPPLVANGWAVKFFPYDRDGKRLQLKEVYLKKINLPSEMVRVDFKHVEVSPAGSKETPLEVFAGFTGLSQNPKTFALKPEVGWMIRKRDDEAETLAREISSALGRDIIKLRIREIPEAIFKLGRIPELHLSFIDSIKIPGRIKEVEIDRLNLTGKISEKEIKYLIDIFPDKTININGSDYNNQLQLLRASPGIDEYKPISGVKFNNVWIDGTDGSYYSICNGFIPFERFSNDDLVKTLEQWNLLHPDAEVFPITATTDKKNEVIEGRSTFCLVKDGNQTLNEYLVKTGVLPAKYLERPIAWNDRSNDEKKLYLGRGDGYTEEYKVLMNDKSYRKYIKQIYAAEQYARANKLGIYRNSDTSKN